MQTLRDYTEPIDFLFLDGWKDLYLPLFKMLEPRFHKGTLIYADNMDMAETGLLADYIYNKSDRYSAEYVHGSKGLLTKVI